MRKFSLFAFVFILFLSLCGCSGSGKIQSDARNIYEKVSQQDKTFRASVDDFFVQMEKSVKSGSSSVKVLQEKLNTIEKFVEAAKKETAALSVPDCNLSKDVIKTNTELLVVVENVVLKMLSEIINVINDPTMPANAKMRQVNLVMQKGMSEEFKGTGGKLRDSLQALHKQYYKAK